jgi:AcrR family transcriptional regulator
MVYRTSAATQERKDAKRRHIVETAAKVFATRGYTGTTVKEIVDAAEVSVGSFYFYFQSKEEIFAALYDEMSDALHDQIDRAVAGPDLTLAERFTRATVASLSVYEKREDLARILIVEAMGMAPIFHDKIVEKSIRSRTRMEELLTRLDAKGVVRAPDPHLAAIAFDGTFQTVVTNWLWTGKGTRLTEQAFALSVYNLQALGIAHSAQEVERYIQEYLANPPIGEVVPHACSERKTR